MGGRLPSESVAALRRITHTTLPAKGCEGIEGFFCNRCLYGGMVPHTSL
jgi:hypothetical protein